MPFRVTDLKQKLFGSIFYLKLPDFKMVGDQFVGISWYQRNIEHLNYFLCKNLLLILNDQEFYHQHLSFIVSFP